MRARLADRLHLTRGEKAYVIAYAAVIAMSAGMTLLIATGISGINILGLNPTLFNFWIVFAGGLGGGMALRAARGWMGKPGALGFSRAIVGSVVVAILAAIVAGTLILPLYGTVYGPLLLVSEFIAKPWLAMAWFGVLFGGHYLMAILEEEFAFGVSRSANRRATEQLSSLSRAQLYRRN
jgi:hypothetical protein